MKKKTDERKSFLENQCEGGETGTRNAQKNVHVHHFLCILPSHKGPLRDLSTTIFTTLVEYPFGIQQGRQRHGEHRGLFTFLDREIRRRRSYGGTSADREKSYSPLGNYKITQTAAGMMVLICPATSGANQKTGNSVNSAPQAKRVVKYK